MSTGKDSASTSLAKRKHDANEIETSVSKRPRLQAWISSKPFVFLIGPERKEFLFHQELLAKVSEPLRALVYGGMKESIEGKAEWPDVDEATFVRFSEFVYDGKYTDADETVKEDHSNPIPRTVRAGDAPHERSPGQSRDSHSLKGTRPRTPSRSGYMPRCIRNYEIMKANRQEICFRRQRRHEAIVCFLTHSYGGTAEREYGKCVFSTQDCWQSEMWSPDSIVDEGKPLSPVLACHYKLYVLADKYIIPDLMAMAHNRLHETLYRLRSSDANVLLELKALVEMVWRDSSHRPIMDMLLAYFSCFIENIRQRSEFKSLLKQYPDFAVGLLEWTCKRLER